MKRRLFAACTTFVVLALGFLVPASVGAQQAGATTLNASRKSCQEPTTLVITGTVTGTTATQGFLEITDQFGFADYVVDIQNGEWGIEITGNPETEYQFAWEFSVASATGSDVIGTGNATVPAGCTTPPTTTPTTAPPTTTTTTVTTTTAPPTTTSTTPPTTTPTTAPPTTRPPTQVSGESVAEQPPVTLPRTGSGNAISFLAGINLLIIGAVLVKLGRMRQAATK